MRITRREWHRLSFAGVTAAFGLRLSPAAARGTQSGDAAYRGVTLGVQSYSFRDRPLDAAIAAMQTIGLRSCELWQSHLEPGNVARADLRRWRETVPLEEFRKIAATFRNAGITLSAYNISFRDDFSDPEIDRAFAMARILGAPCITASSTVSVAARVESFAARHNMRVGMHNHSRIAPNEFATPESFAEAMKAGPNIVVNLDIGHFTAANFDAVDFLRRHHESIVTLHIKDRKRDQGPNVPFGEGDSPIGPVLRMLRDQRWPIPANIEYEYKGGDTVEEVRRCLEYCRKQLDT